MWPDPGIEYQVSAPGFSVCLGEEPGEFFGFVIDGGEVSDDVSPQW